MSMPNFPEINPEMTREKSLNMILTSIAMEELGLNHIINAEGEILKVNESVTRLLDSVFENQVILKNKLEKVLDASPPCLCVPPCEPETHCKTEKNRLLLQNAHKDYHWKNGKRFPWKCHSSCGNNMVWNESDPSVIRLCANSFHANHTK